MTEHTDQELEQFLNAIDQYESNKVVASELWKKAFLSLTQARLQTDISSRQHDPLSKAATTLENGELKTLLTGPPPSFGGAWPSTALKKASEYFSEALKHELSASRYEQATKI